MNEQKSIWILKYRFLAGSEEYPWTTKEYDDIHELIAMAQHKLLEGDEVKMYEKSLKECYK